MKHRPTNETDLRVVLFSRYCLGDQYKLTPEFGAMISLMTQRHTVLHMSLRGKDRPMPTNNGRLMIQELPMTIDRSSPRGILMSSLLMYFLLPSAARRLRAFKPDVIFLTEILPLMGLFLKWTCRTKVATFYGDWHFHNMLANRWWSKPLLKLVEYLDGLEVRKLDGFLCRGSAAKDRLINYGADPHGIRVVRDSADPNAYFPRDASTLRRQCGFDDEDVVLFYHGVMHQGKGLDMLLQWTASLYKKDSRIGIILVGGGPEEQRLKELTVKLGINGRAHFAGWVDTIKEIGDHCNAADISIAMRTATEANDRVVPGALVHSMACRKVVVGPRLSGISEIIRHGENGFMFSPDDGKDFEDLITRLASDRASWEQIASNAYQDVINHYSVDVAARQYSEALEHLGTVKA